MFTSLKGKTRKIRQSVDRKLSKKKRINQAAFLGITVLIIFSLVILGLVPKRVDVRVGDIATEEIRANKEIPDSVTTEKYRLEAMEGVEPRYRIDTSVQIRVKNDIRSFFNLVLDSQESRAEDYEASLERIANQEYVNLEMEDYEVLLNSSPETTIELEGNIYEVVNQIMNIGAREEDIEYAKSNVETTFSGMNNIDERLKAVGSNIVNDKLMPNKFLDIEATNQEKEKAASEVEPVIVKEGEIIVNRNEIVDQQSYDLLKKAGLVVDERGINYQLILGALLITAIIIAVGGGYLYYFEREIFLNQKLMVVTLIITVLVLLISKSLSSISGYLMPVTTAAILLGILINSRVAVLINIIISVLLAITTSMETPIIVMALLGGVVGAFSSINAQQRSNMMLIGFAIAVFNSAVIAGFGIASGLELNILIMRITYGAINGLLSSVLAIGSMPLWENLFGILTPIKLLELMNPNQPAIKKLLLEAPGTYYHSLLVGNLSESAADEVGANSLLVRVGSYYHDIGKTKRPYFFKENQTGMDNPHDKISPYLSAKIITSHTKDGVEMAEEYLLPKEIKDIMVEHHGTTLVSFFYHKALSADEDKKIDLDDSKFRYTGSIPQTKESAIVMLADSIEAAARAMKNPDKEKMEAMIKNIVKSKLDDGQLDECGLTLKDIKKIEKSFAVTLMGIYHERIEYPNLELADIKEGK